MITMMIPIPIVTPCDDDADVHDLDDGEDEVDAVMMVMMVMFEISPAHVVCSTAGFEVRFRHKSKCMFLYKLLYDITANGIHKDVGRHVTQEDR